MKIGKFEIPPKKEKNISASLEKEISLIKKESYIDSSSFNNIFDLIIKDSELFEKYASFLNYALGISIEETGIIDDNIDYDLNEEEGDKKVDYALEEYTGKYFNLIFKKYENASFSEKTKIISFLIDFYIGSTFNNASFSKEKIRVFFTKILENESGEDGNHYIFSYLNSLKESSRLKFVDRVSPDQFIIEKWVDIGNGLGNDQLFISDKKDFEKIKILDDKLNEKFSNDIYEKYKSYFNNSLNKEKNILNSVNYNDYFDMNFFRNEAIRKLFADKTGFKLEDQSLEEQFSYFEYTKEVTNKEADKFYSFSKKYQTNGFRTFLSIEQGGKEMGDKIIILGEKLPESSANTLFKTYGEMIDATEEVANLLQSSLGEKATPELVEKARESLLVSGKEMLEKYAKKAESCVGNTCEDIGKELEEKLSLAKTSIFAFSTACKVLTEKGEFSFEDFKNVKLAYDKSPLPEKMQEEIIKMHQENTKQYPEKLKELWRGTLKDGLMIPNENQLVVSVSYLEEVVSTMRVIQREDGSWYGASFNVNPTIQGSRIGTELLKEVLKGLAKDKPFIADCYSKNPMLKTYLEKFGFKITKEIENYHNTGELVYEITIFPEEKLEN